MTLEGMMVISMTIEEIRDGTRTNPAPEIGVARRSIVTLDARQAITGGDIERNLHDFF
jgi:hypothetical protein